MKRATESARVDVAESLADAVADVAPVGRARDVFIVKESISGVVLGDRRGLARLLRNVLENAVRFSPRSGRVRVTAEPSDRGLDITVSDEGPGIEGDDVERIFEPFARGARSRDPEGTGLGLTIARELARSYGGDVQVSPGPGGQFVVQLRSAAASDVAEG